MTAKTLTAAHSGVYRTPQDVDALRASASAARLDWIEVDLARVATKAELLNAIATACAFPAGFGHNWDALADALADFSWRSGRGYVLHLRGAVERSVGSEWNTLLEVLHQAAREWQARGKPFIALIDSRSLPAWL